MAEKLESFLARTPSSQRKAARCCQIPPELLSQVEEAYRRGHRRWKTIVEWLRSEGVEAITSRDLRNHVENHMEHGDA